MRILYLDLDALNPNHLGCYGYHRDTSPTIDRLAAQGLRCDNVYTSDAPCLPSRTAFYSGRLGIQTGVVGHGGTAAEPKREGPARGFRDRFAFDGLAARLKQQGLHTVMFSPFGERHAAHWFYAGFKEIHNTGKGGMEDASEVMPGLVPWLEAHAGDDDWYLHVNFWDIHTPYRVPDDYGNPFEDDPVADWFTDELIARHVKRSGPHSAQDLGMYGDNNPERFPRLPVRIEDRDSLKKWIDGYDTAIRYVDDQVARIVDLLRAAGTLDDTVIIISADHGENQGDLGIYGEHGTADQGTCHIPMIIRWPGGASGEVDDSLHYHLDLAPTLMDLLGGETPEIWDGQSFAGLVVGRASRPSGGGGGSDDGPDARPTSAGGREDLVISQCCHVCQRSSRWDADGHRWLYIRTYHDGFHPFDQETLFDLAADPHELNDLAADRPEVCREGAWRLMRWHEAQMQKMAITASDVVDPLWTVIREGGPHHASYQHGQPAGQLSAYLDRLEQTGRADGADRIREVHGEAMERWGVGAA
jgi:arylsulfatase A-like enzyme